MFFKLSVENVLQTQSLASLPCYSLFLKKTCKNLKSSPRIPQYGFHLILLKTTIHLTSEYLVKSLKISLFGDCLFGPWGKFFGDVNWRQGQPKSLVLFTGFLLVVWVAGDFQSASLWQPEGTSASFFYPCLFWAEITTFQFHWVSIYIYIKA